MERMKSGVLWCFFVALLLAAVVSAEQSCVEVPEREDGWFEFLLHYFPFLSVLEEGVAVHTIIYSSLVIAIIYLLSQKSYRPEEPVVLTDKEIEECIAEYRPEPLVTATVSERIKLDSRHVPVLSSAMDTVVKLDGKDVLNFAGFNFLGFANDPVVKSAASQAVRKYGPGSCGPRMFYGTFDCHLDLEKKFAEYLGAETCILYASGLATQTSAISAFAKRGDILLIDQGVRQGILLGGRLSRAQTKFFEHNDMQSLEEQMKAIAAEQKKKKILTRRYVVVEGLYSSTGTVCPLAEVVALCKTYRFRLIVDDSFGIGVLGKTGRGIIEHSGVPITDVEMVIADTGITFTTIGGICVGKLKVTNHQRLNGSGYCFSASNPPYYVCSGIESVKQVMQDSTRVERLHANATMLHRLLQDTDGAVLTSFEKSPVMPMVLSEEFAELSAIQAHTLLQLVVEEAQTLGVALTRAKTLESHPFDPKPAIRVTVTSEHTPEQVQQGADVIKESFARVLQRYRAGELKEAMQSGACADAE